MCVSCLLVAQVRDMTLDTAAVTTRVDFCTAHIQFSVTMAAVQLAQAVFQTRELVLLYHASSFMHNPAAGLCNKAAGFHKPSSSCLCCCCLL
jgi:hypothetical protein